MRIPALTFFVILSLTMFAQDDAPSYFAEISEYPEYYNSNLLVARMVDGLGFRYYWATEGLRPEDLEYKIGDSSRSAGETIEHIYGLSKFLRNSILENDKDSSQDKMDFKVLRTQTLKNLRILSEMFKSSEGDFKFENIPTPFWNLINGPIEDALWHCGQIVMLRRSSGNPFNSNVSVFQGKVRK